MLSRTAPPPRRPRPWRAGSCRCPGGPEQKGPLGNLGPELGESIGVLQEVHELHDLLLGLLASGHVGEGDADVLLLYLCGVGFPDLEDAARTTAPAGPSDAPHTPEEEDREADHEDGGAGLEQLHGPVGLLHVADWDEVARSDTQVLLRPGELLLEGLHGPDVEVVYRASRSSRGRSPPVGTAGRAGAPPTGPLPYPSRSRLPTLRRRRNAPPRPLPSPSTWEARQSRPLRPSPGPPEEGVPLPPSC